MNQLFVVRGMEPKFAEQNPKAKQMEKLVYTAISNEASALGYAPSKVKEIRANYENYISSITDTVRG